jgi:hypothetical protein
MESTDTEDDCMNYEDVIWLSDVLVRLWIIYPLLVLNW